MWLRFLILITIAITFNSIIRAQKNTGVLKGIVKSNTEILGFVSVGLAETHLGSIADTSGNFFISNIPPGKYKVMASSIGYYPYEKIIEIKAGITTRLMIIMEEAKTSLNEVVVTGTMRTVRKADSPVPIEIYTPRFFRANPTPTLFESLSIVNGVKPQINCNVCNTGDIHMNGMEGPYTMVLIDGMPIVSALSTVYGLSGIPNSMVERLEIVKGPASSLYGSEAMGGIINVITKTPSLAPRFSADIMTTSWHEHSADISTRVKIKNLYGLFGANYFNFLKPYDKNDDTFTDLTLQERFSLFNKWNYDRPDDKAASIAMRYVYENRWGGQTNWSENWRGSDSIYGESIYTNRFELIGTYQLPLKEKIMTNLSYNLHDQDSYYGITRYDARQSIVFGQIYWDKNLTENNSLLVGSSLRYTWYDDNTPATSLYADTVYQNNPMKTLLPGLFIQDEIKFSGIWHLLLGLRYDYDKNHGNILSPRAALKINPWENHIIRASFGTGYRVVNLFAEDHAALTGAREVVILENLLPERSYNGNLNYAFSHYFQKSSLNIDISGFYSYFTNQIVGDFDTDPNQIIYKNLDGHAITQGVSFEANLQINTHWKLIAGFTYQDVYRMVRQENNILSRVTQLHAPQWSGNYSFSYIFKNNFTIDLTGFWDGPMRLPVLPNDYRPEYSPWFTIANIQLTKKFSNGIEVYTGIKNLLNFIPDDPIMRPFDPFDKHVNDPVSNPYNYTFDPGYNFAPLQGFKAFLGIRYTL